MNLFLKYSLISFFTLGVGSTSYAQDLSKTLLYCDFNPNFDFEDTIYMDVYFDYDSVTNLFVNPEVGLVNASGKGYPDYLWPLQANYTENATELVVSIALNNDALTFSLPAMAVSTPTGDIKGVILNQTNGKLNAFDVLVTGTYNSKPVNSLFKCYDPSTTPEIQSPILNFSQSR